MPTANIPTERMDNLAREAVVTVFDTMIDESVTYLNNSDLLAGDRGDLLKQLPLDKGLYSIAVSFVGDATGKVMLILPYAVAERFTLKLFDATSLDWIEGDTEETLLDTLGELGNMLVGLVKGGMTRWYPNLMLTTPKVLKNRRLKVENSKQTFRKQYLFEGFGSHLMIDFCCE